jgi:hypothetical protein
MQGLSIEERAMLERVRNFKSVLDSNPNDPNFQKLKTIIEDKNVQYLVSREGQKLINEKARELNIGGCFKEFINEMKEN